MSDIFVSKRRPLNIKQINTRQRRLTRGIGAAKFNTQRHSLRRFRTTVYFRFRLNREKPIFGCFRPAPSGFSLARVHVPSHSSDTRARPSVRPSSCLIQFRRLPGSERRGGGGVKRSRGERHTNAPPPVPFDRRIEPHTALAQAR